MGNVVAARRLRKSLLKDIDKNYENPLMNIKDISLTDDIFNTEKVDEKEKKEKEKLGFFSKVKIKYMVKITLSCIIVCACLLGKMTIPEQLKNQRIVSFLINEYQKDYSKEYVLEKLESFLTSSYETISYVVPEELCTKVKEKYIYYKPKILGFSLKEYMNEQIYPQESIQTMDVTNGTEDIKEVFASVGTGTFIENQVDSSAVSIMQDDVGMILSKNIDIKAPVSGTITSVYGARDEVFEGVNSYHTGTDIANVLNTEIKSATDGIVTKVQVMDKYYGNNIEIEKDGVIFKYAHLNEIKVNEGDEIKQGDIIGLMGSTGMSTGSHLHFEIIIDGRTVDPQKLVQL